MTEIPTAFLICRFRGINHELFDENGGTELPGIIDSDSCENLVIKDFLNHYFRNYKGSQLKNPDISGALYILRIQYSYTQTQCEDGARDVRVLQYVFQAKP